MAAHVLGAGDHRHLDVYKRQGGEVVGTVFHPLNASDFASFLLQAQASKAPIIAVANRCV